jgi:hypothetical protein
VGGRDVAIRQVGQGSIIPDAEDVHAVLAQVREVHDGQPGVRGDHVRVAGGLSIKLSRLLRVAWLREDVLIQALPKLAGCGVEPVCHGRLSIVVCPGSDIARVEESTVGCRHTRREGKVLANMAKHG